MDIGLTTNRCQTDIQPTPSASDGHRSDVDTRADVQPISSRRLRRQMDIGPTSGRYPADIFSVGWISVRCRRQMDSGPTSGRYTADAFSVGWISVRCQSSTTSTSDRYQTDIQPPLSASNGYRSDVDIIMAGRRLRPGTSTYWPVSRLLHVCPFHTIGLPSGKCQLSAITSSNYIP